MKHIKKTLALLLVLCMVFGTIGTAYGSEIEEISSTESTEAVESPAEETTSEADIAEPSEAADVQDEVGEPSETEASTDEAIPSEADAASDEEDIEIAEDMPMMAALSMDTPATTSVEMTSVTKTRSVSLNTDTFYRIFHLDAGRKYFSVAQIEAIIDQLSANNYTHLELAVGNDALRFVLDDMSVTANGTTYTSDSVKNGIVSGNNSYYNDSNGNYLTQNEMDTIIAYAKSKNIGIIPLINTPGHMDSIIDCMEAVGISSPAYNNSARTVDVTNAEAVNFTLALVEKYITYFAGKGCKIFNMGCDEYANDVYTSGSMGFGALISNGNYDEYITYVNNMAAQVQNAGMVAMAFNDGIYFNNNKSNGTLDTNIAVAYWTSGWSSYTVRSAANLVSDGFKIINTNDGWYYVLGRSSGTYGLSDAKSKVASTSVTSVSGSSSVTPAGCMICVWCDTPSASYSSTEVSNLTYLISNLASNNSSYFVPETSDSEITETDEATGITVTAEGLTGLDVVKKDTASYSAEGKKVIGYDITPKDANGNYEGEATVTIPVPTGWNTNDINVYDVEENKTLESTVANGTITFTAAHFSEYDIMTTDSDAVDAGDSYTSEQSVSITVGGTATVTVSDANYAGTYTTADTSIATVSVTGQDAQASTLVWNSSSVSYSTLAGSSTSWTKTSYYYKSGDDYYPVWAYKSSRPTRYYVGYSTTDSAPTSANIANRSSDSSVTLWQQTGTEGQQASTTITFRGVAIGTTSVVIGGVKYNINVVDAPPSNAMTSTSLTLEYWITNYETYTTTSKTGHTATIASTAASTDEGVAITAYAPEQAYSFFDGTVTVYYWQSMRLDSDNKQTNASGDDETADGTTFTKVRYHAGAWQYMTADGTWNYFLSTDQAVAYYLQKTDVTTEVTTYMKDWGYSGTSGSSQDTSGNSGQVDLSVAVVYPDGTVSPAESSIFPGSSVIFNYWSGRDIGIVAPVNNSDYDIEKITYTYGTRTDSTTSNTWNFGTSAISWNKVTNAAGTEWYDETIVWDDTMGTTPVVNGAASNITWTAKNTGVLILIYLKPVHKDTNLTVQWMDDTDNAYTVITSQEVVVDSTSETKTFLNSLVQSSNVQTGTITLDDNAYVTNSSGVNQTFNKDLTTMQNIPGQYTSGLYTYKGADISGDGMTLTLHYSMDTTKLTHNYVVDFGLPVTVSLSDLGITSTNNIKTVTTTSNASYDSTAKTITYTPSTVLTTTEAVTVRVEYTSGNPTTISVGFMPATTVYYEEGFASYSGTWSSTGSKGSGTQTTSAVKTSKASSAAVYGYDSKYASESNGASNGTQATTSTTGASASFTFTGTGIDVYANSTTGSGSVLIQVKKNGTSYKLAKVYTKMKNGSSAATDDQAVTGYNIPVYTLNNLDRATYEVIITSYGDATINLDGFRVYGTLDESSDAYVNDLEDNPNYIELRNAVIKAYNSAATGTYNVYNDDSATDATVAILSNDADYSADTVADLLENGPKNELYLQPNQAITFSVSTNRQVEIGLKALNAATSYTVNNGTSKSISTSTDMFYSITSGQVVIKNIGSGILSITKIKVCDDPSATLVPLTADDIDAAIEMLDAEPAEEEPEITYADASLAINLVDYAGKQVASATLTANGIEGETASFAAADIQAAAEAVLPSGYAFADASAIADASAAYGESAAVEVQVGKVATLVVTYKKLFGSSQKVTLTAVQTSSAKSYTFSTTEIKAGAPAGYKAISLIGTKVNYGSTKSITATCR